MPTIITGTAPRLIRPLPDGSPLIHPEELLSGNSLVNACYTELAGDYVDPDGNYDYDNHVEQIRAATALAERVFDWAQVDIELGIS